MDDSRTGQPQQPLPGMTADTAPGVAQRPTGWRYGWLGGMDVGQVLYPAQPFTGTWDEALADMAARPVAPVHPSPLHVHDAGCWPDAADLIVDNIEGPGYVCAVQARWPTRWQPTAAGGRELVAWDWRAWYVEAVVLRTAGWA